jgi:hypothetical protein
LTQPIQFSKSRAKQPLGKVVPNVWLNLSTFQKVEQNKLWERLYQMFGSTFPKG